MTTTNWIQAISTLILVLVTAFYAWRTHVMSKEMKEQRYDTFRPVIDIQRYETPKSLIQEGVDASNGKLSKNLVCILRNIGVGPAIDIYYLTYDFNTNKYHNYYLGTLGKDKETGLRDLSTEQKDGQKALVVYYRDVYSRHLKSFREVTLDTENDSHKIGPLQISLTKEDT